MARSLTTDQRTALSGDHVIRAHLVEIGLDTGTVRFCDAAHNISYGGNTWTGAGALGGIEVIEEGLALESRGIRMTLSGIPTAIASAVLSEPMVFRPVKIYTAIYNRDTHALIDTPVLEWSGLLDSAQLVTQARE
ncbi:MAG: hypothetical protein IT298_14810 [Chloroflexi bacterium]|nr:hypothetical protein [Chloroflexota bacterium]